MLLGRRACVDPRVHGQRGRQAGTCPLTANVRHPRDRTNAARAVGYGGFGTLTQRYTCVGNRDRFVRRPVSLSDRETIVESNPDPSTSFGVTLDQLKKLVGSTTDDSHVPESWHTAEGLASRLNTSLADGLVTDPKDFSARTLAFGVNKLPEARTVTFLELVWEALQDFTLVLLLVSGIVSLVLGLTVSNDDTDWIEGAAIFVSVIIVVLVSAATNYQKEAKFRQLNAIKDDIKVRVIRDGEEQSISCFDLLVGDVVLVETGDILPADGMLYTGGEIKVDESHMTGESNDVTKVAASNPLLISGSKVRDGFGRMLVLAVGPNSQQGIISTLVMGGDDAAGADAAAGQEPLSEETMLERKLQQLAGAIGGVGVWAAGLVFVVNLLTHSVPVAAAGVNPFTLDHVQTYLEYFITSITILVVAVPEGLPLAVTLALAFSVQRMLNDNNLVRHLDACETMACATTICSDKTGTLTENNMRVVRLWAGSLFRVHRSSRTAELSPLQSMEVGFGPAPLPLSHGGAAANGNGNGNGVVGGPGARQVPVSAVSTASVASVEDLGRLGVGAAGHDEYLASASTMTLVSLSAELDNLNVLGTLLAAQGILPATRELLLKNITVNSTANVRLNVDNGRVEGSGNRTEVALLEFVCRLGGSMALVELLRRQHPPLASFGFSSARKRSSVLVDAPPDDDGVPQLQVLVKGAAEVVVERCTHEMDAQGNVVAMDPKSKRSLLASFSNDGLRMLAMAYRDMPCPEGGLSVVTADEAERNLVLVGVVGLEDPLRPEVPDAILECKRAGITVRMLTGDNPVTATAIARQCGILPTVLDPQAARAEAAANGSSSSLNSYGAASASMDGVVWLPEGVGSMVGSGGAAVGSVVQDDDALSSPMIEGVGVRASELMVMEARNLRRLVLDGHGKVVLDRFAAVWPHMRVIARCTPSDKYMMVRALRKLRDLGKLHEVVAVTGDGTNDAPALTAADVGFAMNSGTSVAKDASDILLLDDNFTSIVSAVKWGRNVYVSITRFLQFQLTANIVAVVTAAGGALVLQQSPLSAVQMLWVNLIMDSLASLSLATEAPTDDMLDLPPQRPEQSIITPTVAKHIVGQALFQLLVLSLLVARGPALLGVDTPTCNTMVFNGFVAMQLANQINCRKIRDEPHVFEGITHHRLFVAILGAEFVLQALIVQFGGKAFETTPLNPAQWALCLGMGAATLAVRGALITTQADAIAQRVQDAIAGRKKHA